MPTGTVVMIDGERGIGFIARSDGAPDICFHSMECAHVDANRPGTEVEFQPVFDSTSGKLTAANVKVIDQPFSVCDRGYGGTKCFGE